RLNAIAFSVDGQGGDVHPVCDYRYRRGPLAASLRRSECGKHVPHPEYWLKFCEGVGLSREYVINAEPLPGVKFAVDHWTHGAAKSWLHGVAMSETGDSAKGIARNLETLRKHYSWIPEWALEFWTLHSEVDVEHSQLSMEILGKYCTTKE